IAELIGNVDHSKGHGSNSAKARGDLLNDIRAMALPVLESATRSPAKPIAWQSIKTAPKEILTSNRSGHHGHRIVAYDTEYARIITCRWWQDRIGDDGQFIDDGGNTVFPSKWIDIDPPEDE